MAIAAINLAMADYPRLMPIATGAVRPLDIDLTLTLAKAGAWGSRSNIMSRALIDPAVHGGEASLARQVQRIDLGDRRFVALPVFPLRNLTARHIYVRSDGAVRSASDLAGRRTGMYGWFSSASVWYRHLLRFLGVDPASLGWCVGPIDALEWMVTESDLPAHVRSAAPGRTLSDMLIDGELDALFTPYRPARFNAANGPIVRLFPDFQAVEHDYVRAFGIWPPLHVVVLRREAWASHPSIARGLTDAFERNNAVFDATIRSYPHQTPWMEAGINEMFDLLGAHGHDDGLEGNRAALELFCNEAHRAGLTRRRVAVNEIFEEYLDS